MKTFNAISLVLIAPIIPMLKALEESKGIPNEKVNFIFGLYGYLVATGVLFNVGALVVFLIEASK